LIKYNSPLTDYTYSVIDAHVKNLLDRHIELEETKIRYPEYDVDLTVYKTKEQLILIKVKLRSVYLPH